VAEIQASAVCLSGISSETIGSDLFPTVGQEVQPAQPVIECENAGVFLSLNRWVPLSPQVTICSIGFLVRFDRFLTQRGVSDHE